MFVQQSYYNKGFDRCNGLQVPFRNLRETDFQSKFSEFREFVKLLNPADAVHCPLEISFCLSLDTKCGKQVPKSSLWLEVLHEWLPKPSNSITILLK